MFYFWTKRKIYQRRWKPDFPEKYFSKRIQASIISFIVEYIIILSTT